MRTDAPARGALGITTILSITKIGFGEKGKPMFPYPTAMDVFVIICFGSVFAALLEFATITFIAAYINRYKANEEKEREALENLVKIINEKLKSSDTMNGILSNKLINKIQNTKEPSEEKEEKLEVTLEDSKSLEAIEIVDVEEEGVKLSPKGFIAQLKVHFDNLCNISITNTRR